MTMGALKRKTSRSSNRTTMELKPLQSGYRGRRISPSNRTTMELKQGYGTSSERGHALLIEPLWN